MFILNYSRTKMRSLITFEMKKFSINLKNIVVILLCIVSALFFCFLESKNLDTQRAQERDQAQEMLVKLTNDAQEYAKKETRMLEHYNSAIDALENKFTYAYATGWKESLKSENKYLDSIRILQDNLPITYLSNNEINKKSQNTFYLKHNIKPDNSLYGVSGMYFVRYLSIYLFSIVGYIIFLMLFFDLFFEKKTNEHLLKTLPMPY